MNICINKSIPMQQSLAALAVLLLCTTSVSADIFDIIAGRQPILPVYNAPATKEADRVEVKKPIKTGHEVINPLTPFFPRQVVVDHKLETHYETKWVKIPTTLYRPAVDLHARPGQSILFKPVETYTWRLRQVPVQSYRPVLEDSTKNIFSRTYIPRLSDILDPIFPRCDTSTAAKSPPSPYYDGSNQPDLPAASDANKDNVVPVQPVEPADQRPSLDPESLRQPETTPNAAVETRKVEIPEDDTKTEGESVLKKPIITPAEEPATDDTDKADEEVRDPNQPIPDPAVEEAKPETKTVAPELVNPLDRTVQITIPQLTPVFVGSTVSKTLPVRPVTVILDDEGWIPLK
ncbi:MAG: hypothetical protein HOB73_07570 [Planctomycetaceae bacterium]|jgi:hypothetical protein|nr:hypothetical protein [Planctomycetaceae bacterium]